MRRNGHERLISFKQLRKFYKSEWGLALYCHLFHCNQRLVLQLFILSACAFLHINAIGLSDSVQDRPRTPHKSHLRDSSIGPTGVACIESTKINEHGHTKLLYTYIYIYIYCAREIFFIKRGIIRKRDNKNCVKHLIIAKFPSKNPLNTQSRILYPVPQSHRTIQ